MITHEVFDICAVSQNSDGPTAINSRGKVVGSTRAITGTRQAFLFHGSTLKLLDPINKNEPAAALDINHSDIVVGYSGDIACKWSSFVPKQLPGGEIARTITDAGIIGGNASFFNPVKWVNDTPVALDQKGTVFPLDYPCRVTSSDSKGNLFGYLGEFFNHYSACRWDTSGNLHPVDLANYWPYGPGHRHTQMNGANSNGLAVGHVADPGDLNLRGYFWAALSEGPLPSTPSIILSRALDVNATGQIVGFASTGPNQSRAVIWNGNVITDLNHLIDPLSGWVLSTANCINDSGDIAGVGTLFGAYRAYVMRPFKEVRKLKIPHMVWHIIAGVRGDQPGIVIGPNGEVSPVPPWNPLLQKMSISAADLNVVLGLSQSGRPQRGKR